MTDSGDRPLPPSYEEAIKVPSAPSVGEQQPHQGQPSYGGQPSYPPYARTGQPPYPSGSQGPYGNRNQTTYPSGSQAPYLTGGQGTYPSARTGPYPYQPPQGYGTQSSQVQYNSVPGHSQSVAHDYQAIPQAAACWRVPLKLYVSSLEQELILTL
ncbi:hypothetical protein RRG08_063341 [Elysia crispata]|uniref:Uncharacterized protein n=1 Tax=Elysia crispata TaxID=231223 RepID=A0AAE1B3M3_9GAST|nr:hypothetical protein RRG08_063341 [Elysia crispata]